VTGKISGIAVVDFDSEEAYLLGKKLGLPKTPTVETKRGYHCYFKLPPNLKVSNFQKRPDLPNIDLRAEGGYVVAPPSLFQDGMGQYTWLKGQSLNDLPLANLPKWVLEKSNAPLAMDNILFGVPEGKRNTALCHLAGIACHKGHNFKEIYELTKMWNAQNKPPLPDNELFTTVAGIFRSHQRNLGKQKQTQVKIDDIQWPDPQEPDQSLLPVPPFNIEHLPQAIRLHVVDIAERMQVPVDFPAITALVVAATVIGTRCCIAPKELDSWLVTPNLWGAIIGSPSLLKTPTMGQVLACLNALENAALEIYQADRLKYERELVLFEAKKNKLNAEIRKNISETPKDEFLKRLESLKEPEPPTLKRYFVNDATPEKLLAMLADNHQGVLVTRDELVGVFENWNRPGRESERTIFIEGWNGNGRITTDRISRGTNTAPKVCISIIGTIQPDRLYQYLLSNLDGNNDGLLQRFQLMVYPDRIKVWKNVDRQPNELARMRFFEVIHKLASIDFLKSTLPVDSNNESLFLRFSPEAQEIFIQWLDHLENRKLRNTNDSDAMIEHLGKFRSLIPSLALSYHLVEYAEGAAAGHVSKKALEAAISLGEFLEAHARRIYALRRHGENNPPSKLAKYLLTRKLPNPFTTRLLYKANIHTLNTRESAQAAIDELIELGWLFPIKTPADFGQKGKMEYAINPKIFTN